MIERTLEKPLKRLATQYPVVTLTGPRQSGKTTLCKKAFPDKTYLSLEDPDVRQLALSDPRAFLARVKNGAILDEIQKAPELVSYIQSMVDSDPTSGRFILTVSQQFELTQAISQSLAGRTAILRLLPFSYDEIYGTDCRVDIDSCLYQGFYPRIHDQGLNPTKALGFYVNTYIERDVRSIKNIVNLNQFESFLRLCAANVGQELNKSRLSNDIGVDLKTITSWLSVLEASYIVYLLPPDFKNFRKRVTKSPKLYFYDVGLASFLLGIRDPTVMMHHPLRRNLFENFIIMEFLKKRFNAVENCNLYFYRDNKGNEVDLILDFGPNFIAIEIKSAQTFNKDFLKGLNYYSKINGSVKRNILIYSGDAHHQINGVEIRPYESIGKLDFAAAAN